MTLADVLAQTAEALKPGIPLVALLLAYLLGKDAYFQQKEYEIIAAKYLDEGIDLLTQQV